MVDAQASLLVVRVGGELYGMYLTDVREMVATPASTPVPGTPGCVRGLINLRGTIIPLLDLRLRMGMPSLAQEVASLTGLLRQREGDHIRWVEDLRGSVRENRLFTGTLDPHGCGFGRWYDVFHTDDLILSLQLRRFGEPHERIHEVGAQVVDLVRGDCLAEARDIVERRAVRELARLSALFAEVRATLQERHDEVSVILEGKRRFALAVDAVIGVENVVRVEPYEGQEPGISGIGTSSRDGSFILVTSVDGLLSIPAASCG